MKRGNAVIAHGGGPTAVLNASLAGVCEAWRQQRPSDRLFGAIFGIRGLLDDRFADLTSLSPAQIHDAARSPGSIIGSSRQALTEEDFAAILRIFLRRDVHCFFYTGGNGSMDTALRFSRFARVQDADLQVIGVPKTIDNDLSITDHTPGYPSAARFFIHAARDVGLDNRALPTPVCILETLGRNTGWITAATALARTREDDAPHLIYLPERRLSLDRIAADVERIYRRIGRVVVAVCEGQLDETGRPFGADVDRPESAVHRLASNLGHTLAIALARQTGLRTRSEKPGLVGRACAALASEVDRSEAFACGRAAVEAVNRGESEKMVILRRLSSDPYECVTDLARIDQVARIERPLPHEWIASGGNDVTSGFRDYLKPLVGRVEVFPQQFSAAAPNSAETR